MIFMDLNREKYYDFNTDYGFYPFLQTFKWAINWVWGRFFLITSWQRKSPTALTGATASTGLY